MKRLTREEAVKNSAATLRGYNMIFNITDELEVAKAYNKESLPKYISDTEKLNKMLAATKAAKSLEECIGIAYDFAPEAFELVEKD